MQSFSNAVLRCQFTRQDSLWNQQHGLLFRNPGKNRENGQSYAGDAFAFKINLTLLFY